MDLPPHMLFPKTLNQNAIQEYLNRKLTVQEKNMLENFEIESAFNDKLEQLYVLCNSKNLYIPILTNLDGNCLFESLVYHGIGTSIQQLRQVLSFLLYIFKDHKYLFPDNDSTLKELFDVTNEVSYVKCSDGKNYAYTYDTMCQDITNMHAWNKLPTELILMLVSYIFKVEIIILHDVGTYENNINMFKNSEGTNINIKKIYLGQIQESHYFPLDHNSNNIEFTYYDTNLKMIKEWVTVMQDLRIKEIMEDQL